MTQSYWNYDAKPCQCCGQIHDGAELWTPLAALVSKWRKKTDEFSPWDDAADELEAALAAERPSNHTSVQRAVTGED
jgi:hypothetical protein